MPESPPGSGVTLPAPAKINLTLDVGGRRADGYHAIRSIMQTLVLADEVSVARLPGEPGVRLRVSGPEAAGIPAGPSNLVHQAAVRLQKIAAGRSTVPPDQSGLEIVLVKNIPAQAGLGGGSSDAAATLRAVNRLLDLRLAAGRLAKIGAALGADVPFFLTGGCALVEGLGEQVTSWAPLFPAWPLVVVKPPVGVPTPWAYAALDAVGVRTPGQATETWMETWRDGPGRPDQRLGNDFERVVLPAMPAIAAAYDALRAAPEADPAFPPLLCGSGSALFRRARPGRLEALADRIRADGVGQVWATWTEGQHE